MEGLLAGIAADADLFSVSCATMSSDGTIVGIGSLSGKAIQAVGEIAIRGMGDINIWRRLRAIGIKVRTTGNIRAEDIEDILELQR